MIGLIQFINMNWFDVHFNCKIITTTKCFPKEEYPYEKTSKFIVYHKKDCRVF